MIKTHSWVVALVLLAACAPSGVTSTGDLTYSGPVEVEIGRGQTLPGTGIQFVANTEQGAQVSVDGQTSTKRVGDSLEWEGQIADGVSANFDMRVLLIADDSLRAAGTLTLVVADPAPRAGPVDASAPARYKLPVVYNVERGQAIPGTPITYEGMASGEEAQLGNIEGDATRKPGELIAWEGQLRGGVWLRLELRTVIYTRDSLNVAGTAELYLAP